MVTMDDGNGLTNQHGLALIKCIRCDVNFSVILKHKNNIYLSEQFATIVD